MRLDLRHYDRIRQDSGNLCRCGAYREIVEAVQIAARARAKEPDR